MLQCFCFCSDGSSKIIYCVFILGLVCYVLYVLFLKNGDTNDHKFLPNKFLYKRYKYLVWVGYNSFISDKFIVWSHVHLDQIPNNIIQILFAYQKCKFWFKFNVIQSFVFDKWWAHKIIKKRCFIWTDEICKCATL